MSETKHAALPWRPALGANEDGGVIVISMDETERNPCVCYGNNPKQAILNALFIAHACNCHDKLVAALRTMVGCIYDLYPGEQAPPEPIGKATLAALAVIEAAEGSKA